ncbi:MAG TPA: glycoside hydrolase family 38 C-terminal domain-containing protein [Chloroflexota bacterium]
MVERRISTPNPVQIDGQERVLVLVSHTHWDREWYLTFQQFRLKLGKLVDQLLDILAAEPDYRSYMLDGQTVILEDYLELRPGRRRELEAHLASGRVLVGPWYVLPDEFLVSGEAIVRNLLRGRAVARLHGAPVMPVGYIPDPFGHVAQMPQILRGFGIESAVVWRGVGDEAGRKTEFRWRSPDGSEVLTLHLGHGYFNAAGLSHDPDEAAAQVRRTLDALGRRGTTRLVVLMHGVDHMVPRPGVPRLLAALNARLEGARVVHGSLPELFEALRAEGREDQWPVVEGELRDCRYAHLLPGVLSARMWIKQRNATTQTLLERWAEPLAALASATVGDDATARDARRTALALAWKYLLQNHPHDSICGCSVDAVHEDMRPRFDAADQIGEALLHEGLEDVAARVDTRPPEGDPDAAPVLVFNPLGVPRGDWAIVTVPLPEGSVEVVDDRGRPVPSQDLGVEEREVFCSEFWRPDLQDALDRLGVGPDSLSGLAAWLLDLGKERDPAARVRRVDVGPGPRPEIATVRVEVAAAEDHDRASLAEAWQRLRDLARGERVRVYHLYLHRIDVRERRIGFVAADVPPCGYRTFFVRAGAQAGAPVSSGAHAEPRALENERLRVEVVDDGTLTLLDKATGTRYPGLHVFLDEGDAGDEYNFSPPASQTTVLAPMHVRDVVVEEAGPARATLRLEGVLPLPAGLTPRREARSTEVVECPVTVRASLLAGGRRVDFETTVENRATDHRLRVLFPTGRRALDVVAETAFGVVRRPVALPSAGEGWVEDSVGTQPQQTFVDLSDGDGGLLLANQGLPEYEVLQDAEGRATVVLTLLRCVGWLSRPDLRTRRGYAGPALPTPGAQLLGRYTFRYALVPHEGRWEAVQHEAHAFNAGLRAILAPRHDGPLPPAASFVAVTPSSLVLSAVKLPEEGDSLVVRLYNPTPERLAGTVRLWRPFQRVERVNLAEEPLEVLSARGRAVSLAVGPSEVVTLRFQL